MPTYNACGIRMRLGTTSLADTVTPNRDLKFRKNDAVKNSDPIEKQLRASEHLREERVPFPDDSLGSGVNFLRNVPFLQVEVDSDVFKFAVNKKDVYRSLSGRMPHHTTLIENHYQKRNENISETQLDRCRNLTQSARWCPDLFSTSSAPQLQPSPYVDRALNFPSLQNNNAVPKALVLHIFLSEKTFLACSQNGKPQHLMIDVFLNGILTSSVLMHLRDISSGAKSMHQIFSGIRVGFLMERPWLVLPPGQNIDGSHGGNKETMGAEERWDQICRALMQQADERGVDKLGWKSPSADYLESLASIEIPERVKAMQQPGGRKFGVVDVVVTAGVGQKTAARYLQEPMRLRDSRYKPVERDEEKFEDDNKRAKQERLFSDKDAEGETDPEFEQPLPTAMQLPSLVDSYPVFPFPSTQPVSFLQNTLDTPRDDVSPLEVDDFATFNPPFTPYQQTSDDHLAPYSETITTINPRNLENFPISGHPYGDTHQVSVGEASVMLYNPMPPPSEMPIFGISRRGTFTMPGSPTDMSPLAQCNRAHGLVHFEADSFDLPSTPGPNFPYIGPVRHYGPLPPVGLFSAPPSSPPVDPGNIDPDQPRSSMLISRVVITGKNGAAIVDHYWPVSQRVAIDRRARTLSPSPTLKRQISPGQADYSGTLTSTRPCGSTRGARMMTPLPTSPQTADLDLTSGKHGFTRHNERVSRLVKMPTLRQSPKLHQQEDGPVIMDSPQNDMMIDDDIKEITSMNVSGYLSNALSPEVTSAPILGIQEPRAPGYIFDDPEELMRRQARSSRARARTSVPFRSATIKAAVAPVAVMTLASTVPSDSATGSQEMQSAFVPTPDMTMFTAAQETPKSSCLVPNADLLHSGSSSLSSVPSSPEPKAPPEQHTMPLCPVQESTPISSQLVEATSTPKPPHRLTAVPRVPDISKSTSLPSQSGRSATTARPQNKRKKPTRTDTVAPSGNPPLNQDCVIAFAEKGKDGEAMLRQIKAEKQGVFTEDMVVVGMRFFVPG